LRRMNRPKAAVQRWRSAALEAGDWPRERTGDGVNRRLQQEVRPTHPARAAMRSAASFEVLGRSVQSAAQFTRYSLRLSFSWTISTSAANVA
jgi:hypothetical protein